MPKALGVWGIDIGQCALKALRCRVEGDAIVADGFDFIEYPKILSQPESNAAELVREALETFLSRNDLRGDKVAVSVPGQSGLARYFKPPPVDAQKIAEIVKYEAKQQIPFPLEDVIWDYQRMGGGTEVDGVALETEIGLFAMKRDQVYKALQPFFNANIEVDFIQLAPLSIYNYVVYDLLEATMPPPEEFDPDSPPPSTVVISMGTDTTDLVVTNGYRVWQRNIPLGGNHFTRQLTKELKLTFAKAEHLKRNAHTAEDPRAIFQAMRPIFNDMVTEIQRSLNFFQSLDKKATIQNVLILGNTIKLPGLQQYLTKHLGYEVIETEELRRLSGEAVVGSPTFKDNVLAYGVCYGLCLQGTGKSKLITNLLPPEILTERMIKAKKPWAVAAAGAFLLACTFNYLFHFAAWNNVHLADWTPHITSVSSVSQLSQKHMADDAAKQKELQHLVKLGEQVVGNAERRVLWLELLKAINEAMPQTPGRKAGEILDFRKVPFDRQHELHIEAIESQYFADLKTWFEGQGGAVKTRYLELLKDLNGDAAKASVPGAPIPGAGPLPGVPQNPAPGASPMPGAPGGAAGAAPAIGPTGPGWVIELRGHHYFNKEPLTAGANHVRNTLIRKLEEGTVSLPLTTGKQEQVFTMKELGIGYPVFATDNDLIKNYPLPNPNYGLKQDKSGALGIPGGPPGSGGLPPKEEDKDNPEFWRVDRYEFVIQFCWQEQPLTKRLEERAKRAAAAAAVPPGGAPGTVPPGTAPPGVPAPAANVPAAVAPVPAAVPVAPAAVPVAPAAAPVAPAAAPAAVNPLPPAAEAAPVAKEGN